MKYLTLLAFLFYAEMVFGQAGKIDSSFGINGEIEIPYDFYYYDSNAGLAIQNDGKILICSSYFQQPLTVSRFNSNGTLDSSFGQNGIVPTIIGFERYNHDITIEPDGKILICGFIGKLAAIERLNQNGIIDSTFNDSGVVAINLNPDYDYGFSAITASKDKIIAVGTANVGGNSDFGVLEFNYSGDLDTSFNKNGKLKFHLGEFIKLNFPNSVYIDSTDKITVLGSISSEYDDTTLIFRTNKNGSMDSTFNGNGIFYHSFINSGEVNNEFERSYDMQIQNDGKIIITGSYQILYYYPNLFVLRINSSGKIDSSFNNNSGIFSFWNYMKSEAGTSLSIDHKNNILISDMEVDYYTGNAKDLIIRLNENGIPDSTFGDNSISSIELSPVDDPVNLVSEKDGGIILEGQSQLLFDSGMVFLVRLFGDNLITGTFNFSKPNNSVFIYPNPILESETLQYSLAQAENISINLYDVSGRFVQSFFSNQKKMQGDHKEEFNFNPSLPAGDYVLVISNGKNRVSIKVVKQ